MIKEDFFNKKRLDDIGRWYINNYVISVAQKLPRGASILDAGAGECVYKKLFEHCRYFSIDLAIGESNWSYENLDYVAPLDAMPIEDAKFDAVLCTQVLEHLEFPQESIAEMYRVLKSGGVLYITAPMAHPEHQIPYDYFRFTSYGLRALCNSAGFREIRVQPFGGMWVRWAYELPRALSIFPRMRKENGELSRKGILSFPAKLFCYCIIRFLQLIFLQADRFDRNKNDPFGWSCEAVK